MNYLIVCPKFTDSMLEYYTFPVGVAYVNASLKQVRNTVYQLNLNYKDDIYSNLADKIKNEDVDCLIVGGTSLMYNQINEILDYAREIKPSIITIVGGGLVTAAPHVAMVGLQNANVGIIGEGEYAIQELADALENGTDLNTVNGIIYRDGEGQIKQTRIREDIQDLDAIPFPDYDGFEYAQMIKSNYRNENEALLNMGSSLFGGSVICTSRSCPYQCTFCFHTCGNKYRQRSLDNIFQEIDLLVKKYNIRYLNILDELFGVDHDRLKEFCERIEPYGLIWRAGTRVDHADKSVYEMMKKAGCNLIGFGIESANNDILKSMKKHITIEQIKTAFELAKNAGIGTTGVLLLGDKNETVDTFKETIAFYKNSPHINLMWSRIIVLPGSEIYKYAVESGVIEDELSYWRQGFPYINVTKMTDIEYEESTNIMEKITASRACLPLKHKIISIDQNTRKFVVKITCSNCNNEYIANTSEIMGDSAVSFNCPHCGQYHHIQIYRMLFDEINEVLVEYLKSNQVFIYGAGHDIRKFVMDCPVALSENVIIVDQDIRKQQSGVCGKQVFSPKILDGVDVPLIINGGGMPLHIMSIDATLKSKFIKSIIIDSINHFLFNLIIEHMLLEE